MRVLVEGSGGIAGWPQPGCRCASCLRQAAAGRTRKRSAIVVDGRVRLGADGRVASAAGYQVRRLADARAGGPGGWDVTTPDGGRLLYPAGPGGKGSPAPPGGEGSAPPPQEGRGSAPAPPEGTAPYDVAFLDLLGDPAQLGWLRARGLITAGTVTAVAYADHRVASEAELARRCGFWRVRLADDGEAIDPARSVPKDRDFPAGTHRVLVLGGARSGKSEWAELRLAGEPEVTYVATGNRGTDDPDWAARVAAHRARRPAWWATAETTDLAGLLGADPWATPGADHGATPRADHGTTRQAEHGAIRGALLIDGIGTWLAAVLDECGWDLRDGAARDAVAARIAELTGAWRQARGYVVAVSDETGLGVVPASAAGRLFRDELGRLNQALAAESEEAELVVAGRVLPLGEQ
jgi:adenosylcobinamide kinase / adenosylcobinamide-phosphate guanylyltransferase